MAKETVTSIVNREVAGSIPARNIVPVAQRVRALMYRYRLFLTRLEEMCNMAKKTATSIMGMFRFRLFLLRYLSAVAKASVTSLEMKSH